MKMPKKSFAARFTTGGHISAAFQQSEADISIREKRQVRDCTPR